MLPEFDMKLPKTLEEALHQMSDGTHTVAAVAGGTNIVPDLRSGRHVPQTLVNLSCLSELKGIRLDAGFVVVGSGVTLSELLSSPLIARYGPPLQSAASTFASPLVRNRATLGGNLVDASPAADTVPPLLALDAKVQLTSLTGSRWVPLDGFITGVRKTLRKPDELVTAVCWKAEEPNSRVAYAYQKLGLRKADAISVVSVALKVEVDKNGKCQQARIALGSVAPTPLRVKKAEEALVGKILTAELITEIGRLTSEGISPIDDLRASASYRRRMANVLVCRLLTQAAQQLESGE